MKKISIFPPSDLEIGFDLVGPLIESNDGNCYKLVAVETKQWEVDGVAGPGLHSSLCYLLVTRGMYKTQKICPNMATKLIHRILCVLYKNGVPMSDKAFGLMDPGGGDKSNKRRKTRPKDLKTETSGESQ